jgi:putative ABC transport system substrate-binding protein
MDCRPNCERICPDPRHVLRIDSRACRSAGGDFNQIPQLAASYGPSVAGLFRQSARYVDKVLQGAEPADLPVEEVSKYDLIVDLRIAQELKIKVPQEILFRADEVIR